METNIVDELRQRIVALEGIIDCCAPCRLRLEALVSDQCSSSTWHEAQAAAQHLATSIEWIQVNPQQGTDSLTRKTKSSLWKEGVDKLLKKLPPQGQWEQTLNDLQFRTTLDATNLLQLDGEQTNQTVADTDDASSDVVRLGRSLVRVAKTASAKSRLITFFFVSYTVILCHDGYVAEAEGLSTEFANYGQDRWKRIREGVLLLHALSGRMTMSHGWPEHRALEMIFLMKIPLSLYEVVRIPKCLGYMIAQLSSKYQFEHVSTSVDPNYSSYTILNIFASLTNSFTFHCIRAALGYDVPEQEENIVHHLPEPLEAQSQGHCMSPPSSVSLDSADASADGMLGNASPDDNRRIEDLQVSSSRRHLRENAHNGGPSILLAETGFPTADGLIGPKLQKVLRIPDFDGDNANILLEFYLNSVCASRTVLRDNAYSDEFIPILNHGGRIMNPILALSASYFKEYLQGTAREQMEKIESNYIVETVRQVRQSLEKEEMGPYTAVSGALLIHHATLNPSMHPCCWSKYLYFRQDRAGLETEAELAMASVSILAMTALPSNGKHHFQRADYEWVGRGEMASMTRVNSTLGLSREMLYFIYLITKRAKYPDTSDPEVLVRRISASSSYIDESEDQMARYIAMTTAQTYKLSTLLYCWARLCNYTPEHPTMRSICESLRDLLCNLPVEGQWYSSIHPAWCFVICCACMGLDEHWEVLLDLMDRVAGDFKTNVNSVCVLIRQIRQWQKTELIGCVMPRWWENMTEALQGDFVICLA